MKQSEENSEFFVQQQMEKLRQAPPRNIEKATRGRNQYLAQARLAAARMNSQQAVSIATGSRLNGWIGLIRNPLRRKEQYSMIGIFSSIMVILALILGGAGATVYAAQDSLPYQGLYSLKIASEEVLLRLSNNEQTKLNLQLTYADRRASELAALMAAGEPAPEQVANRLEIHLRQALQLAAGMDEDSLTPALLQIRTHMRSQERLIEMIHSNMPAAADPVLARVRLMLRQQINLVEDGVDNPQNFRSRLQYQYREIPEKTPAATGNSYGPTAGAGSGPASGLGTQACGECTPAMDGTGPGPGPGPLQNGQTPEPGQGQGTGPGPAATSSQAPGGSGGGEGGGPNATQEPGGGNPDPSQDPGGQGSGGSTPGGGPGHP